VLQRLGFHLDDVSFHELFDEVDGDGDGHIYEHDGTLALALALALTLTPTLACLPPYPTAAPSRHIYEHEFVTMIGMLKRNLLEVMLLEESFTRFRAARADGATAPGRVVYAAGAAGGPQRQPEHVVYAADLVATLGVTEIEAEEMIFIADLKDNQYIDFTEFKQVVVSWSG
jgi:hypothetical protein